MSGFETQSRSKSEELRGPREGVVGGVCGQDWLILYRRSVKVKKVKMRGEGKMYLEHRTCFVQRAGDKP